jgi:hypothetical protein
MRATNDDQLWRPWHGSGSRRGLLGAMASLPLIGELAAAKKRKRKKKKHKKTCKPQPVSTTCAGRCGTATNNCKKLVDCGSCPTGECCGGDGTCGSCLVFVSSSSHDGDLGGLSGADAICQDLADDAGLPGAYMAWLSDSSDSPNSRFVHATVPYVLVDGTITAANWAALTSGALAHGLERTETGDLAPAQNIWTNTLAGGTPGGAAADGHCEGWTTATASPVVQGNTGFATLTTESWTLWGNKGCDNSWRLYCVQQR